ncbi:hypothetical protein CRUP_007350, partial [Coryphaenoides rupestris]
MTARLQTLSVSSEHKESELSELKETIEILKTKNTEAQEIIQGALSHPDMAPQELEIKRQNSSESICSLNSVTSHSSLGSLKEQEAKKKKKKGWLRSSFNKAFSKKGVKLPMSYADIEEISTPETSAPSSPKIRHDRDDLPTIRMPPSASSSSGLVEECKEGEEKSSGLVAMGGGGTSPRQSVAAHGLPKSYSRGLSDSSCSDVFFPADSLSSSLHRDDHRVRVVVCVADLQVFKE